MERSNSQRQNSAESFLQVNFTFQGLLEQSKEICTPTATLDVVENFRLVQKHISVSACALPPRPSNGDGAPEVVDLRRYLHALWIRRLV